MLSGRISTRNPIELRRHAACACARVPRIASAYTPRRPHETVLHHRLFASASRIEWAEWAEWALLLTRTHGIIDILVGQSGRELVGGDDANGNGGLGLDPADALGHEGREGRVA